MGLVDFGVNLEICDALERNPSDAVTMAFAVKKRLGKNDAHVTALSLTLLEMCVKNCGEAVHAAVGQQQILSEIAKLCEGGSGEEVKRQALALVQQWGVAFESRDAFLRSRTRIQRSRSRGLNFPQGMRRTRLCLRRHAKMGLSFRMMRCMRLRLPTGASIVPTPSPRSVQT